MINILFLYYIFQKNNILLDQYQILIGFIILALSYLYFKKSNTTLFKNDNTFSPPPKILSYSYRIILNILIILLSIYQFLIEYSYKNQDGNVDSANNNLHKYFLNRFGGYNKNDNKTKKYLFLSGWSKLIEIFINIILLVITRFNICKYNLPDAWDFLIIRDAKKFCLILNY